MDTKLRLALGFLIPNRGEGEIFLRLAEKPLPGCKLGVGVPFWEVLFGGGQNGGHTLDLN